MRQSRRKIERMRLLSRILVAIADFNFSKSKSRQSFEIREKAYKIKVTPPQELQVQSHHQPAAAQSHLLWDALDSTTTNRHQMVVSRRVRSFSLPSRKCWKVSRKIWVLSILEVVEVRRFLVGRPLMTLERDSPPSIATSTKRYTADVRNWTSQSWSKAWRWPSKKDLPSEHKNFLTLNLIRNLNS